MALWFHETELLELMQDFYTLTGIRIILFDEHYEELFSYPQKEKTLCFCLRNNPGFDEKCRESDARAFQHCKKTGTVHIFKCHAGLSEATAPIIENGHIIGYMMFGQVSDNKNKDEFFEEMTELCRAYGVKDDMSAAIKKIKYRNDAQLRAAARILDAYVHYVQRKEIVHPSGQLLIDSIDRFLDAHIGEEISVDRICDEFNISRTRLYDIIRPYTKGGIASYIKRKRLAYAKHLLSSTSLSVSEVADAAGFSDYNYFLRIFKQTYGISCGKLRKKG
jgi:AraC-like DNA-binding protein